MVIGVLAVQGAFIEHEKVLDALGVSNFEIRQKRDLEQPMDGLILPGGDPLQPVEPSEPDEYWP